MYKGPIIAGARLVTAKLINVSINMLMEKGKCTENIMNKNINRLLCTVHSISCHPSAAVAAIPAHC